MKRSVVLPHGRNDVYRVLMDPILLSGWLDIPYVSTGYGELHLFELEDWAGGEPWKVRGFISENERGVGFRVEKDEVGDHAKPTLDFRLEDTEEGCVLHLDSSDSYFEGTLKRFLDPKGHSRLGHLLRFEVERPTEAS